MRGKHIALLRGINVGGKHRLPMKELVALFEDAGCQSVRTYIQSGNVVFEANATVAKKVGVEVSRRILERFGFRVPVILRTAKEYREAAGRAPFAGEVPDPKHLYLGFLASAPSAAAVKGLDPARSSVDRFVVLGREVYLHVPGGVAGSKLTTDYFDRRLETTMTTRNWRTVTRLLDMVLAE